MPLCQLPGADLFFAEKGEGEPLLFLSGLGGDHLYWLGQLRAFGKQYRCLAIDNRDAGQSTHAVAAYTNAYFKQNHFLENDWSDLLSLIGVLNLTDQNYKLNPLNLHSDLPRDRTLLVSVKLSF